MIYMSVVFSVKQMVALTANGETFSREHQWWSDRRIVVESTYDKVSTRSVLNVNIIMQNGPQLSAGDHVCNPYYYLCRVQPITINRRASVFPQSVYYFIRRTYFILITDHYFTIHGSKTTELRDTVRVMKVDQFFGT